MRTSSLLLGILVASLVAGCQPGEAPTPTTLAMDTSSTLGFVLTDFTFEQPPGDVAACEDLNLDERELYIATASASESVTEADVPRGLEYLRAVRDRGDPDPCPDPAAFDDAGHTTLDSSGVAAGFDLDGVASTADAPGPNACPHLDFADADGQPGIDNQLWRLLGCVRGYQRGNTIDEYALSNIKNGARTILVQLSGVDDRRNDDHVEVGVFTSPDPIPVDAAGRLLSGASLSVTEESRYQNVGAGRLVDGVIEVGPLDLRLDFNGQFLDSELDLRSARLRLELLPDGNLRGVVGGYWNIEQYYDTYARQATRSGVFFVGFRCPAMYDALQRRADAFPDPDTGHCTAISTAFRLSGIPAFVIEADSVTVAEAEPPTESP